MLLSWFDFSFLRYEIWGLLQCPAKLPSFRVILSSRRAWLTISAVRLILVYTRIPNIWVPCVAHTSAWAWCNWVAYQLHCGHQGWCTQLFHCGLSLGFPCILYGLHQDSIYRRAHNLLGKPRATKKTRKTNNDNKLVSLLTNCWG